MSPWRKHLYRELRENLLRGHVVDLGGDRRSDYHEFIRADKIDVVNLAPEAQPDHVFDLERPFPLGDASYDGVICLNVLEHIYNYAQFLAECRRILRPGGKLILAVPFVMQVHPSPHDYFRYTEDALRRLLFDAGFTNVGVKSIGKGPFTAAAQIVYNPIAKIPFAAPLHAACCMMFDRVLLACDRKNTFSTDRYPLGFIVTAQHD